MNWQIYKLKYKIKSPLYIGFHKLGYVQRTRYYVPGRTMWGAGAEYLARSSGDIDDKVYAEARKFFSENALFSYFYLQYDNNLYLPRYTEQGVRIGTLSIEEFETKFIASFGKTAVEPQTTTAEEGSLHEIEFIQPLPNLYLVGYLFLKKDAQFNGKNVGWQDSEISLKSVLQNITIGGERRYGFGKITLKDTEQIEPKEERVTLFGLNVKIKENNGSIVLTFSENTPLFSHLEVINTNIRVKGDIEVLVGREYKIKDAKDEKTGFGQVITPAKICWSPGSIIGEMYCLKLGVTSILEI